MATTVPDSLWSPDDAEGYDLVIDLGAMQTSVQSALNSRPKRVTATTGPGLTTSGLNPGDRGWASSELLEYVWTGTKWMVVGGQMPLASMTMGAVTAVNGSATPIPLANGYIGAYPTSMWSSGNPTYIVAPIAGFYQADVMTRWSDATTNIAISLNKASSGNAGIPNQYLTQRNGMISGPVYLDRNEGIRVTAQSYSGNQALTSGHFSLTFIRTV